MGRESDVTKSQVSTSSLDDATASVYASLTSMRRGVNRNTATVRRALFGPLVKQRSFYAPIRSGLSPGRQRVHEVIESLLFKALMAVVVIFNLGLVVIDTDMRADGEEIAEWIEWCSLGCLLIYVSELAAKIFVDRCSAFLSSANWFDFFIVASDVVFLVIGYFIGDLPSFSVLRIVRILRALRIMRSFMMFRELYLMMLGLISALRAIIFATILIAVLLTMWSIVAVELMNKINRQLDDEGAYVGCKRCRDAFSSVGASNLTFLKGIIAGDSWGEVSIPLMEAHPWTACVILTAFLSVQIGLLNVVIAVIVDRQSAARAEDDELIAAIRQEQLVKSYGRLIDVFKSMDEDGSGLLSFDELQQSYETCDQFKNILDLLDIGHEDLALVFDILDKRGKGEIGYEDFVLQLHALKSRDSHTLLVFTKHYAAQIWEALEKKHLYLLEQLVQQNETIMRCQRQMSGVDDRRTHFEGLILDDGFHQDNVEATGSCRQFSKELPTSKGQTGQQSSSASDHPNVHVSTLRSELERLHRHFEDQVRAAFSETADRLSVLGTGTSFAPEAMASSKWEPISEVIPSEKTSTETWDIIVESERPQCLPDEPAVPDESEACGVPEPSYTASDSIVSGSSWYHAPQAMMVHASQGSDDAGNGLMASPTPKVLAFSVGSNLEELPLVAALPPACASDAPSPQASEAQILLGV